MTVAGHEPAERDRIQAETLIELRAQNEWLYRQQQPYPQQQPNVWAPNTGE